MSFSGLFTPRSRAGSLAQPIEGPMKRWFRDPFEDSSSSAAPRGQFRMLWSTGLLADY